MTRPIEEQLSALLDGELPEAEEELLLRRLDRDAMHWATMARYSLIGEVMRGAGASPAARLGERVRAALAGEATHAGRARPGGRIGQGVLAAGVAASLVAVALFSLGPAGWRGPSGYSAAGVTAIPRPAVASAADAGRRTGAELQPPRAVLAPARLTGYLVSHGEYANRLGRQVMDSHIINQTPDVLAASYTRGIADD